MIRLSGRKSKRVSLKCWGRSVSKKVINQAVAPADLWGPSRKRPLPVCVSWVFNIDILSDSGGLRGGLSSYKLQLSVSEMPLLENILILVKSLFDVLIYLKAVII